MAAPTVGAVLADILPYLEVEKSPVPGVELPDLCGLTAQQAEKKLKTIGLTAVIEGDGDSVYAQLPMAGQTVYTGTQVLVYVKKIE